jgi:cation transport regulator
MMHDTTIDLPDSIRQGLPEEAQEVYRKAYAASWDTYSELTISTTAGLDRGAIAHRDAWDAVLKEFEQDSYTGQWHRRGEKVVAQPEKSGLLERIKSALTH